MSSTRFCQCRNFNANRLNNRAEKFLTSSHRLRNRKRTRIVSFEIEGEEREPHRHFRHGFRRKKRKSSRDNFANPSPDRDALLVYAKPVSDRKNHAARLRPAAKEKPPRKLEALHSISEPEAKECCIQRLPHEILLLIFNYLPLSMLLLVIPHVCKKWKALSMDWTLWKAVEHLRIKTMVVTTKEVCTLLNTIPKLKKLELILRNDTEELLQELFRKCEYLETLRLDRCVRNRSEVAILPDTARSILDSCPKLKSVSLMNTHFRSKKFYERLALKFKTLERINISCTTKSEMDFFVENLKRHVPKVEFQNISMMGRAGDKQIYWGPILGLIIRPNPTSPYHRRPAYNEFPNYAF